MLEKPVFEALEKRVKELEQVIVEVKQSEIEELRKTEKIYQTIFHNLGEGIFVYPVLPDNRPGNFIQVNQAACSILEYSHEELTAMTPWDLYDPESIIEDNLRQNLREVHENKHLFFEAVLITKEGRKVQVEVNANSFELEDGAHVISIIRDITKRKYMEDQLRKISLFDSLTQLYSRVFFMEEMRRLGDVRNCPVGIIVCDIDGLKLINDTLGHSRGDVLLKEAADILSRCFRTSDIVARIGGDEFAILLPKCSEDIINTCRLRIQKEVDKYNEQGPEVGLSISIGYSVKYNPPVDMNALFKRADDNMYKEKIQQSHNFKILTFQAMIKTMEIQNYKIGTSSERLQGYVRQLGEILGLSGKRLNNLNLLSRFHDLGKVGVPDEILYKPGPLTEEEYKVMQRHSEIGHRIALSISDLSSIADLILKHHEWWNGQGYPLGLEGEQIPLECRILAIAYSYDALTNDRPYRKAMSQDKAIEELRNNAGTQFDPDLVEKFIWNLQRSKKE